MTSKRLRLGQDVLTGDSGQAVRHGSARTALGNAMTENLIKRLVPHQGCVITPIGDGVAIAGSAMNWVMSAAVAPMVFKPPFAFRVVGQTDSTNLRMHFHRGELIFNWECNVRELRVHDPATAEQHPVKEMGFLKPGEWHEIVWEIGLDRMRVLVNGETRFEKQADYSGIASAPSVGPCFGSTVSVREFTVTPLA
jgi:hypothetical protein